MENLPPKEVWVQNPGLLPLSALPFEVMEEVRQYEASMESYVDLQMQQDYGGAPWKTIEHGRVQYRLAGEIPEWPIPSWRGYIKEMLHPWRFQEYIKKGVDRDSWEIMAHSEALKAVPGGIPDLDRGRLLDYEDFIREGFRLAKKESIYLHRVLTGFWDWAVFKILEAETSRPGGYDPVTWSRISTEDKRGIIAKEKLVKGFVYDPKEGARSMERRRLAELEREKVTNKADRPLMKAKPKKTTKPTQLVLNEQGK